MLVLLENITKIPCLQAGTKDLREYNLNFFLSLKFPCPLLHGTRCFKNCYFMYFIFLENFFQWRGYV
jgi:hypothetical protein